MIYLKKVFLFFLLIFLLNYGNSIKAEFYFGNNDEAVYGSPPQNLGLPTTQSSGLVQYGNIDILPYNGLLNFSIDLGGYKDVDFELPISVRYISDGFKPQRRPSSVGNNWVLNCGGIITRSVKGSPDDVKGYYTGSENDKYLKDGLLAAIRTGKATSYTNTQLINFDISRNEQGKNTPYTWGDFKYDMEPDIFKYTCGKYSGSFFLENFYGGEHINLLQNDGCKIDISGLTIQDYSTNAAPRSSTIKITTPDGYIYTFGGDVSYLEYFIPQNPKDYKKMPRHIISWYLKLIEAPNGREVSYNYDVITLPNIYRCFAGSYILKNYDSKNFTIEDKIWLPVLKNINVGKTKIQFNTKLFKTGFYKTENAIDPCVYLESIEEYYDDNKIKTIGFEYLQNGNYFFLSSLNNNGSVFDFEYNFSHNLPTPLTISVDGWGFWNGEYKTEMNSATEFNEYWNKGIKSNKDVCDATLLKKIIYPTGGKTEIEYEHNRYTHKLVVCYIGKANATDSAEICGGARVKSIKDFDAVSNKNYNHKTYYYKKSFYDKDCGFTKWLPTFRWYTQIYYYGIFQGTSRNYSYCNMGTTDEADEYHISYPYIMEIYDDNSYLYYEYTSFFDIPDKNNTYFKLKSEKNSVPIVNPSSIYSNTGKYIMNDLSRFRGKLLKNELYDLNGELKRKIENKYNYIDGDDIEQYAVAVMSTSIGPGAYFIYLKPCLLTEQTIWEAPGITTTKKYSYNDQNLISKQTWKDSRGKALTTKYEYSASYESFRSVNLLNAPISQLTSLGIPPNDSVIEFSRIQYKRFNENFYRPFRTFKYGKVPSIPSFYYDHRYSQDEYVFIDDNMQTEFNYDEEGRLMYEKSKDGLYTFYVWGYNYQYPIIKIQKEGDADIRSSLSGAARSFYDFFIKNEFPADGMIRSMWYSLNQTFPNSIIDIYTYKPWIGMSSHTDNRGFTTYYDYDVSGRLKEIYFMEGDQKKILESYKYNLSNK